MGFFKPVIVTAGGSAIELADNLTTTTKGKALDASQAPIIVGKIPDVSGLAKKADIPTIPDLTKYALKTDIPDLTAYVKKANLVFSSKPITLTYDNNTVASHMHLNAYGEISSSINNPGYARLYATATVADTGQHLWIIQSLLKDVKVGIMEKNRFNSLSSMEVDMSAIAFTTTAVYINVDLSSVNVSSNLPLAKLSCITL